MKLLIIEDEVDFLQELAERLLEYGHEVTTATAGDEGWALLRHNELPDAVITDIKMPGLDGLELVKRIRKNRPKLPVVIMSGHGDLEVAIQALRLETFDFLVKPFNLKDLLRVIDKLKSLLRPTQELKRALPFYTERIELSTISQVQFINPLVLRIRDHFEPVFDAYQVNTLRMHVCLLEAITNAIVHGNLEVSSELRENSWEMYDQAIHHQETIPELRQRQIKVSCHLTEKQISFEIQDEGAGFDINTLPNTTSPGSLLVSGRGILLIRHYMDEVSWNDTGNCIRMVKRFPLLKG